MCYIQYNTYITYLTTIMSLLTLIVVTLKSQEIGNYLTLAGPSGWDLNNIEIKAAILRPHTTDLGKLWSWLINVSPSHCDFPFSGETSKSDHHNHTAWWKIKGDHYKACHRGQLSLKGRQWMNSKFHGSRWRGPCDNLSTGGATEQFRHITHKLQNVSPDLVMHMQFLMSFWAFLGPQMA